MYRLSKHGLVLKDVHPDMRSQEVEILRYLPIEE